MRPLILRARRDYYRFLLRSLEVGLENESFEKTMGKEFVAGGKGKVGLFEVLCWRFTILKEVMTYCESEPSVREKMLDPKDHQRTHTHINGMVWTGALKKKLPVGL